MATSSMDTSTLVAPPPTIHIVKPPEDEDEDDDFNDIIVDDDTPEAKGDNSGCEAVNYKVSMDEFQKVDVFKAPTTPDQAPEPLPSSPQGTGDEPDGITEQESAKKSEEGEEPRKAEQSLQSDESLLTHQSADGDNKTGDPVLPNGTSQANAEGASNGVTTSEEILKTEVSRSAVPEPSEQLLRAQAEWDAVETIQPGEFCLHAKNYEKDLLLKS